MKDEIIALETAKLAKDKKFNILVKGFYTEYLVDRVDPSYPEGGGIFSMNKGEVDFESDYIMNNHANNDFSNNNYICYAAPTQSLLQRWIRETHNIHVGIDYDVHGWMFFITEIPNPSGEVNWSNDNYKTYEEALESGLRKALTDYIK